MPAAEIATFHDESFQLYLRAWRESSNRDELEMGLPEAAYHVLAHAGMLRRLRGESREARIDELSRLPKDERFRLVREACQFSLQFGMPEHFQRFLAQDVLDADELGEIEGALLQRDEFDAVLSAMDQLVGECLASDDDLLASVARAHCVAAELDDQLAQRPDILSVASRVVADYTDPAHYGAWLVKARRLDEEFFEPTLREFLPQRPLAALVLTEWSKELAADGSSFAIAASEASRPSERHQERSMLR
ncbi:MAG: hypothetical protein ACREHD_02290, partial [Pirellulales bacterium]